MFDPDDPGPEYTLRWPPSLLQAEAAALEAFEDRDWQKWSEGVVLLLTEAFKTSTPAQDFKEAADSAGYLSELFDRAADLPTVVDRVPYYAARRGIGLPAHVSEPVRDDQELRRRWVDFVRSLGQHGYFVDEVDQSCVRAPVPVAQRLNDRIADVTDLLDMWPPNAVDLQEDGTFYTMVEVVHDLVARPRTRSFHAWDDCGWHYEEFSRRAGQAVYRLEVNRLLERHGAGPQLADSGAETGRLVRVTRDGRDELIDRVIARPDASAPDRRAHAVALFRRRLATGEDKRSAVVKLAGLLEERRKLLKKGLVSKDEGALFNIANGFDLRLNDSKQQSDYDEAFLDWIFWWYLATLDLTDQLLARNAP